MKIKTLRFNPLFLISFSFIFSFFTSPLPAQTVLESDSLALVALYNSTNGDNWTRNDNWLVGPVNSWYGIELYPNEGVGFIRLTDNNLIGHIPEEIGNLISLRSLILAKNQLSGVIPSTIGNLTNLLELLLQENELTENIPNEIGNLNKLLSIYLNSNQLTGNIPNNLDNIVTLRNLDLSYNNLTGEIPKQLGNFNELELLILNENELEGKIPVELGNLSKLRALELHSNHLQGNIPPELGNLSYLESLLLFSNKLTGNIPPELGNLKNLAHLWLSGNQLEGTIPRELGNLVHLKYMALSGNNLTGNIPSEIGSLNTLEELCLDSNKLTGNIPNNIGSLENLRKIGLSNNRLDGFIPHEIENLTQLTTLNLHNNQLKGGMPFGLTKLLKLEFIDLSKNQLSGGILDAMSNLKELWYLNLSSNLLIGWVPSTLTKLTKLKRLYLADNYFNKLPDLTSLYSSGVPYSYVLDIRNNTFTFDDILPNLSLKDQISFYYYPQRDLFKYQRDTVQVLLGDSYVLDLRVDSTVTTSEYHWFKNGEEFTITKINKLSFENITFKDSGVYTCQITNSQVTNLTLYSKPVSINVIFPDKNTKKRDSLALVAIYHNTNGDQWLKGKNWLEGPLDTWNGVTLENNRVVKLWLNSNNLTGELPTAIGDLTALRDLNLSFNSFSCSIPKEIGNLTELKYVGISPSKLTGAIPKEIGNLTKLETLWLSSNHFSGKLPSEMGNLKSLTHLYMSAPNVTGLIPPEFGKLTNLKVFAISGNFTGPIPNELGNLLNLEILNLSSINIVGSIPENFGNLVNLKSLMLFKCNLTGSIPPELGNLINLTKLQLFGNKLSGTIPIELGNLKKLNVLDLSDNQIIGEVPIQLNQLSELEVLFIHHNQLTDLPDFTSLPDLNQFTGEYKGSYSGLRVENNNFTFKDILPNLNLSDSVFFTYIPQDSIGQTEIVTLSTGESFTIDLDIDSAITTNEYRWFKDSVEIEVTHQNSFTITEIAPEDAGVYTCEVTNPAVDSLTLYSRPVTLIVKAEPIPQTITFDNIPDKTYGDKPFLLSATSDVGLEVLFEIISGSATLSADTLNIMSAGNVTVIAFNNGNDMHLPASVERAFTVAKASQTISFDAIPDKTLEDGSFEVFALASSGLAVNFSVEGPASLESTMLTLSDTGKVSITATQPGNENYLPAEAVIRTFVVKAATFNLSGKVTTEAGAPAGSGTVILYTPNETGRLTTFQTEMLPTDGLYQFTDLKAGEYSVGVIPDNADFLTTYLGNGVIRSEATLIALTQNIENQNIKLISKTEVLSGNASISGILILEESNSGGRILVGTEAVEGTPLAGISVYLMNASGDVIASDITNTEGKFAFTHIPNGFYIFKADYAGMPHDTENFTLEVSNKDMEVTALVAKEGIVRVQEVSVVTGGTDDEVTQAPLLLYPNPTDGRFSILLDTHWLGGSLIIHTIDGQPIAQKVIHSPNLRFDLSHAKAGVYVVTLQKGEIWQVLRLNKF